MIVEREDHTLGNMLRMQLLEDPDVIFSGYRVQHPLEPAIQCKIQTKSEDPGPIKAVEDALGHLLKELSQIETNFSKELASAAQRTNVGTGATGGAGDLGQGYDPISIG